MNIQELFSTLTSFSPRDYQQQTIARILSSQNTILRAPTGSGKTETAIAPFVFAKALNIDFPNKLIYVVPLRTLANSLYHRACLLVERWQKIYQLPRPIVVTLQTGENPDDPRFEGDIVFCTIDQLLSSFLNIPYSVGRGSGNVNAGMVFASYLVFDEVHLLDQQRSFATVLKLLQQVRAISPFLLMTATLTDELAGNIIEIAGDRDSFITVSKSHLKQIEGYRQRFFNTQSRLTAQAIYDDISLNNRQRVIVICNTIAQAQGLFQELDELQGKVSVNITLLHSRFLPEHRAEKEAYLQKRFSRNWTNDDVCDILIATQVIEVGLNITCEVMHTLLCPMNSLLQRVGRCARFDNETGKIIIYRDIETITNNVASFEDSITTEENTSKKSKYPPYENEICELTWQVLETHNQSQPVNFQIEEIWINQVHRDGDKLQAQLRENNQSEFENKFNQAVFYGDKSGADDLIRHIDNRNIFVWEEISFIDFEEQPVDPKKLIAFAIPITTLLGIWYKYQNQEYKTDWLFKRIENPKGKAETYSQPVTFPILSHHDLINSFRILVNPKYLEYDENIGLRIGVDIEGKGFTSPEKPQTHLQSEYQYHMDNYVGHLVLMWHRWRKPFETNVLRDGQLIKLKYSSVRDELLTPGGRFIHTKIFPQASLEQTEWLFEYLVLLAIFTHDLGKLQVKWQKAMVGWQEIAYREFKGKNPKNHLLAHTDYNPEDENQRKALKNYEKTHKRPTHAVESAFLANYILQQTLPSLLQKHFQADKEEMFALAYIVMMAAGRHHSAFTKGWGTKNISKGAKIDLHPDTQQQINQSWRCLVRYFPQTLPIPSPPCLNQTNYPIVEFSLTMLTQHQMPYLQLYLLIVRALRLCDMRAVQ